MKYISALISAFLAGVVFSFTGIVQLQADGTNAFAVAAISTVGLLIILTFNLAFFTSKVGYLVADQRFFEKRLEELPIILVGNLAGPILIGVLLHLVYPEQFAAWAKAYTAIEPIHIFIKAFFCGVLMFIAAHGFLRANGNFSGIFIAFLAMATVTFCGLNHFITDLFFIAGNLRFNNNLLRLVFSVFGNTLGALGFAYVYTAQKVNRRSHHHHRHHSQERHKDETSVENSVEENEA